jgi:uncharacterized lipoprotein YajG
MVKKDKYRENTFMLKQIHITGLALLVLLLSFGCSTSPFRVTASYIPVNKLSSDLGKGDTIRLIVLDDRSEKDLIGITQDIYKRRIELGRPALDSVENGFRQALSTVGFVISEDAPVTLEAKIVDMRAVWAARFSDKVRATVTFDLRIISRDGRSIGSKRYSDSGWQDHGVTSDGAREGEHALSVVLSRAVEKAIADPALRALYNEAVPVDTRLASNRNTQVDQPKSAAQKSDRPGIDVNGNSTLTKHEMVAPAAETAKLVDEVRHLIAPFMLDDVLRETKARTVKGNSSVLFSSSGSSKGCELTFEANIGGRLNSHNAKPQAGSDPKSSTLFIAVEGERAVVYHVIGCLSASDVYDGYKTKDLKWVVMLFRPLPSLENGIGFEEVWIKQEDDISMQYVWKAGGWHKK